MENFIDYYMKWMEEGKMPNGGLCESLPKNLSCSKIFKLITPNGEESVQNAIEGGLGVYWGITNCRTENLYELTPLRETILLLCACINEEY